MYKDEVNVINIQSSQLVQLASQVQNMGLDMQRIAEQEEVDKDSLKAYIASADIIMNSIKSQQTLLQQALDKLAGELNN